MLEHQLTPEHAADDYFHGSTIYLTPAVSSISEAIDLAVNFSLILDGKPHFLDPAEHDSLTTITEEIPQVLSIAAYAAAMKHKAWGRRAALDEPALQCADALLADPSPRRAAR